MSTSVRSCRECGCTDQQACAGGCCWVAPDLCSSCEATQRALPVVHKRRLVIGDQRVKLSPSEAIVVTVLLDKAGQLVDLQTLHAALYPEQQASAESNVLQVLVSRLRKKLAGVGHRHAIETIRARGYRFVLPEGGAA